MPEHELDTSQAFKYHWLIWKIFGLQPPKRDSKWFKPYIVYAIALNISILLYPISFVINLILSKNMIELCENLCNTTTDLVCNIKFFNTILVRKKLLEVRNVLKRLDARAQTRKDAAILEEGIAAARGIFILFSRICCCAVITSQIIVFFSSERILMYPAWFPWNWKESNSKYLMAHFYQLYGFILQATQNLASDTYPAAYFIILSAHIKALASRIQDLGNNGTNCEETIYKELKDCIKDHNTVHKLFLNIQEIISTTCLVQFTATGLAQCTMGVYIIYVGTQPSKLLNLFIYFLGITTEIFILCYYGDLYCQANAHLTDSIYACNWMDRDEKFKNGLKFILHRSQMSSTLMAGSIIPVQMPTFVKVMKTAYSVFTVLNQSK